MAPGSTDGMGVSIGSQGLEGRVYRRRSFLCAGAMFPSVIYTDVKRKTALPPAREAPM